MRLFVWILALNLSALCLTSAYAGMAWDQIQPAPGGDPVQGARNAFAATLYNSTTIYKFGGIAQFSTTDVSDQLWQFDIASRNWTQITPIHNESAWPSARKGHSMICWKDSLFVFGGETMKQTPFPHLEPGNELWKYNIPQGTWTQIFFDTQVVQVPAMSQFAFNLDSEKGIMYVVESNYKENIDVWAYHLVSGAWSMPLRVPVRTTMALAYTGFIVALPGTNKIALSYNGVFSDIHLLATGEMTEIDMAKQTDFVLIGASPVSNAVALSSSLVLIQTNSATAFKTHSSATIGNTFVWDIETNSFQFISSVSATILFQRAAISVTETQVLLVSGNFLQPTVPVFAMNLTGDCGGDCGAGSCIKGVYCKCQSGFAIPDCKQNCSANPCEHGTCTPRAGPAPQSGVCSCSNSYIGETCSEPLPCVNGHVMPVNRSDPSAGWKCSCMPNYYGPTCDRSSCIGGLTCFGTCSVSDECVCPEHVTGDHCELDMAASAIGTLRCISRSSRDLVGLTWCDVDNPTIAPLRLPPPADPKSIAFDVPPCGDETNDNATCSAVTKISTFGWSEFTGDYYSFILSGMQDGHFAVASFNNDSIAARWRLGSKPVQHVVGALAPFGGAILASDDEKFTIVAVLRTGVSKTLVGEKWATHERVGYRVTYVDFLAARSGMLSQLYPFAVMQKTSAGPEKGPEYLLVLLEYSFNSTSWVGELRNTLTWSVKNPVYGKLRAVLTTHPTGFDKWPGTATINLNTLRPTCSFWNTNRVFRPIVLLYDSIQASVVGMPDFPLLSSGQFEVDMSLSPIYLATNGSTISQADLHPECFSVPEARSSAMIFSATIVQRPDSAHPFPAQLLVLRLDEFSEHAHYCGPGPIASNLTQRLLLRQTDHPNGSRSCKEISLLECPIGFYSDGTQCSVRSSTIMNLSSIPSEFFRRFVGPPAGKLNPDDLMGTRSFTWNTTISEMPEHFLYDSYFILDESRQEVDIMAVQQDVSKIRSKRTVTRKLNQFSTPAPVQSWHVTDNGQHMFFATTRKKWELNAQERLVQICYERATNSTAAALYEAFGQLCETPFGQPKPVSYSDFVFMLSMCPADTYCPLFATTPRGVITNILATMAPVGMYAVAPGLARPCEPGYYCRNGRKAICPRGFICPHPKTNTPERCKIEPGRHNKTCFQEGLTAAQTCPAGFVCLGVDTAPVPAPPGYYISKVNPEGPGVLCSNNGSFCPLAALDPAPLCPQGFACASASAIYPAVCTTAYNQNGSKINENTTYCPSGSTKIQSCPAGYVCPVPWVREQCDPGDYCPEGSQIKQDCAAGHLCRTPGENVICPAGFYCPPRSFEARKCSPLALCAEGSTAQRGWLVLTLEFLALLIVLVIYFIVHRIRAKQRQAQVEAAAKIKRANNRFMLQDSESATDHEDSSSSLGHVDVPLLSSSSLSSSSSSSHYYAPVAYARPMIDIEFRDIELKVSGGKKTVLQAVNGRFKPGQLSAIMGPSGAGKSSLLSVLSGEAKKSAGQILVNGVEETLSKYKSVIGFVPQEDIMHRTLSVIEILRFNAATRLPHNVSEHEREELVHDILEVLNLKKVKYSLIGDESKRGLSGGERKRVNIGMELAADPSVLFLDEPTSGLDSSSAVQVVRCLKAIAARSNMTIVCVIHQPRSDVFELFDSVLFLAPGGRTVFQGSIPEAESYFGDLGYNLPQNTNPADYFMDVISACSTGDPGQLHIDLKNLPDEWVHYHESRSESEVEVVDQSVNFANSVQKFTPRRTAGFFRQLWLFIVRSYILQMRDLRSVLLNIFLVFISGMLLGFVYADASYVGPASKDKRAACPEFIKSLCDLPQEDTYVLQFALMNMALGLTAVAGALPNFGNERITYWRESRTGTSSLAFFLGKNLASLPMIILPPLFLLSIFYFLTAPAASFFQMYAILLTVQFVCVAVGYVISLLLAPSSALLAGVVFVVVSTMFSGANPTLAKLRSVGVPALIVSALSFSRWSTEALYSCLLRVYEDQYDIEPGIRYWGYEMKNYPVVDFLALVGLGIGLRVIAFVVLFFLHRNKSS